MDQNINTNRNEERILIILYVLFSLIIAKGIYNQFNAIDQDWFLTPFFFLVGDTIFLLYGVYELKNRQFIRKYTPAYIVNILFFVVKRIGSQSEEVKRRWIIYFLSVFYLVLSIILFAFAINSIFKSPASNYKEAYVV